MTLSNPTYVRLAALALVTSLAAGCSTLESDKIDYKSAGKAPTLEVPPDLTQLSRENRYAIPGGAVSANAFEAGRADAPGIPTAVAKLGDVRMERAGNERWVVVNRPPEQVWDAVRDFWLESGFLLTSEQRNLGILETDWAENRAKLPHDIIRSTLGKFIDSVYSTGELDRFRTRLERSANGDTEIYISHRGMIEVYTSQREDNTVWQPRPVDPELETEFLRRLMVKLGVSQEQSKQAAMTAAAVPQRTSSITQVGGQPVVQINEGFDRAWRRVGLALDRTGFTVEDRNRSDGVYFVRYVAPNADRETAKPGMLGRLFGTSKKAEATPQKYRVQVKSQGELSVVSVLSDTGAAVPAATAQRIVQVIADDLR